MLEIFITELKADGFKNLSEIHLMPSEKFNIITGKNAQGKTNLIEAVWLMTGCRSFRGTKECNYIGFNKDYAEIQLSFQNNIRKQNIIFRIRKDTKEKKFFLNGIEYNGGKKLFEQFKCVAFLPSDTELIDGNPEKRRTFIDICRSQLKPSFMSCIKRYSDILVNRNAVLKNISAGKCSVSQLEIWNEQLSVLGAFISFERKKYSVRLDSECRKLYCGITRNNEKLRTEYHSDIYGKDYIYPEKPDNNMKEVFMSKLRESENNDIKLGFTSHGIHHDDINIFINNLPVRTYGSQGQKKSCCLVMKLAQAEILKNETGDSPVILLDDVMGELDSQRQKSVSEIINGMQVFITSCNAEAITAETNKKNLYIMENGILKCL